jgi:hypothetical protein
MLVRAISDVPLIQVALAMAAVFMKKERKRLEQSIMYSHISTSAFIT